MIDKKKIIDPASLANNISKGYIKPSMPKHEENTDSIEQDEARYSDLADNFATSSDITAEENALKHIHDDYKKTHPHEFKNNKKIKDKADTILKKYFDRNNMPYR